MSDIELMYLLLGVLVGTGLMGMYAVWLVD